MVALAILGQEDGFLPTWRVDKENLVVFGGIYGGLGGLTGPPGSQMVDLRPDGLDEVG